jgi:hypothetical protein
MILNYCSKTDKNKNINYESIAHDWSKKSKNNYDNKALNNLWKFFSKKTKLTKTLTIRTLHYYAKLDNPDEYKKIRIYMYLQMRKMSFPCDDLRIFKVTNKPDMCIIELENKFCPFTKNSHKQISIYRSM